MSAGAVEQSAVGFGVDVGVEVGVDFGRAEDYDVEHVDRRAAVPRVRVPVGGDFYVVRVFGYRAHGVEVEGLHVHELPEQPFFEQLDEVARDAAEAEAALYSLTYHRLLHEGGDGERYAARAGLERDAVFEVGARLDELRRVFRYEQAQRVARDLRRAGDDARGVAYRRDFDDDVGLCLRYGDGRGGVGDEVVGDGYHGVGVVGVGVGVAERAAGGFADGAADVAAAVCGRRGYEGHVDVYVARHDGARASAVAAQDDGHAHAALGDELAYRAVDGAHDFRDDAALYVVDDLFVDAEERRREERQIFDSELGAGVEHHVYYVVAVSEMVVERYRHSAFEAAGANRVLERGRDLVGAVVVEAAELRARDAAFGLSREGSLEVADFAVALYVVGYLAFYCVDGHCCKPPMRAPRG